MAFTLTANGVVYSDTGFGSAGYAQNFEKLIGDIFEHTLRAWYVPVTTWSSDTVFTAVNWNSFTNWPTFGIGSFVYVYSKSKPNAFRIYAQISNLSIAGAVLTVTLATPISETGALPTAATAVTDWVMSPVGLITVPSGTLSQADGGTGSTTMAGAQPLLNIPIPSTFMENFMDDFGSYSTDYNRPGLFARVAGYVNFSAHADQNTMSRYPEIKLNSHPGLCHLYAPAQGSIATIAARATYVDTLPGGIVFSGADAVFECLLKFGGPQLQNGGWSIRVGLTDNLGDVLGNEIGIGIRPFNQNSTEANIPRLYTSLAGVYKVPTVGSPYTGSIVAGVWYKLSFVRSASGNVQGILYQLDEDGNVVLTANLAAVTAANTPGGGLRPFIRLDKRTNDSLVYIETLVDYFQVWRKLTR